MNLRELYRSARTDGPNGETARELLEQTHWFTVNAVFDPKTGDALPQALSVFLAKVAEQKPNGRTQDRLYRITEHARPALERLLRTLNESPRREHAILPVRSVRELDAASFIKLSTRPGRNIREKLAGKPYLQAVRRFQSVDLPENRLLKAFVSRLAELLTLRCDVLGEPEDELLPKIESWLLSDEAQAIGNWGNLPPNNTLLEHRDYRRVWDSWRRLQTLDDDIAQDLLRLNARRETMRRWMNYARKYRKGTHLFADMPVLFDYEKFTIRTWSLELKLQRATRRIGRSAGKRTIEATVCCIDLTALRPQFADTTSDSQALSETFLWQQWKNAADTVDMALFNSDAAYLHPDATTITSQDLFFFSDRIANPLLDRAARAFANRLHETFKIIRLIWLVPDALNDFELEIVRRNLNARFPGAEPLPRSIAALFEQIDYARITNDGYPVVVVDTIGGITCATKMVARFDDDLMKRLPETNGYYWERCPSVILSQRDAEEERRYDIAMVDGNGAWHDSAPPERPQFIDPKVLKDDNRIGEFAFLINVSHSPVAGGMRLHALQTRAGDIPLWRNHIPELSIKGYFSGFYRRFYLVSRGTTIAPIRELSVQIPIKEQFTLPAGKRFYQFPLFQGENAAELRFSARLESPAFPLKSDTACELILTFQYGDDDPYTLTFAPLDKSFPPVRAHWQRTVEENVSNAPAPEYPEPLPWDALQMWRDVQGNEVDLYEWLIHRFGKLSKISKVYRDKSPEENEERTFFEISRRAFVNRIGLMWSDGRALDNIQDHAFVQQVKSNVQAIAALRHKSPRVEQCVWQILSCLHRDTPDECVKWLTEQVEKGKISDPRAVGFALGDVSQEWQQNIFHRLASSPRSDAVSVFAYAIWRERHFIERFSLIELKLLLNALLQRLSNIHPLRMETVWKNDKRERRKWVRTTAEPLELLLGLLRTRASNDPDIRMLLQPHQKMTKQFANQVDRIEEIIAETNVTLFSRVQINIQKPEGIRTPDLLYALRLYLTGDDGANAIHITGISDTDDD